MARPGRKARTSSWKPNRDGAKDAPSQAELLYLEKSWCPKWAVAQPFYVEHSDVYSAVLEIIADHIEAWGFFLPKLFWSSLNWRMVDWLRKEYGRSSSSTYMRNGRTYTAAPSLRSRLRHATDYAEDILAYDYPGSSDPTADEVVGGGLGELEGMLDVLTYREEDVIRQIYQHGSTVGEIAQAYGISPSAITHNRKRALAKLRKALEENDERF